jgi:hypothetical protein
VNQLESERIDGMEPSKRGNVWDCLHCKRSFARKHNCILHLRVCCFKSTGERPMQSGGGGGANDTVDFSLDMTANPMEGMNKMSVRVEARGSTQGPYTLSLDCLRADGSTFTLTTTPSEELTTHYKELDELMNVSSPDRVLRFNLRTAEEDVDEYALDGALRSTSINLSRKRQTTSTIYELLETSIFNFKSKITTPAKIILSLHANFHLSIQPSSPTLPWCSIRSPLRCYPLKTSTKCCVISTRISSLPLTSTKCRGAAGFSMNYFALN